MPSPDGTTAPSLATRLRWLAVKDVRELVASRATWILALLLGPLVGHAFITAVQTYAEVSGSAGGAAALAEGISPLDGVLVPTFGAYAIVATLLLPFVAIRLVSDEKASGALELLLHGRTSIGWMIAVKAAVLLLAWVVAWVPGLIALGLWRSYGGHLDGGELSVVLLGHTLHALLVVAIACAASAFTESAASAAVVTLGVTLGGWALDFVAQVRGGVALALSRFTPESMLRAFERGDVSLAVVLVSVLMAALLLALAALWLQPGGTRWQRALRCVLVACTGAIAIAFASRVRAFADLSEDRRNSLPIEDERALSVLRGTLHVEAHLAPEDPRMSDLRRGVLDKLSRLLPVVVTTTATTSTGMFEQPAAGYGEVWYEWHGRRTMSRSTTVPIVLEVLYQLVGIAPPTQRAASTYPGYPLAVTPRGAALLLYVGWPAGLLLLFLARAGHRRRIHH